MKDSDIKWMEAEYGNGGLISAAASIDQGFRQLFMDRMTAICKVALHLSTCDICKTDHITEEDLIEKTERCIKFKAIIDDIDSKLKEHSGFLEALKTISSINSWYKPSPDEPSIMHDLNFVVNSYTPRSQSSPRKET